MDRKDLLSEVRRAESLVKRKKSRLKRSQGIRSYGKYEPLRDNTKVSRYTKSQLENYLNRLNEFKSRSNQPKADIQGRIIPSDVWKDYTRAHNRVKREALQTFNKMKDAVYNPKTGETFGQYFQRNMPDNPYMHNVSVNMDHLNNPRNPKAFPDVNAVKKLTKYKKKQATPEFKRKRRNKATNQILEMVKEAGGEKPIIQELRAEMNNLTDTQMSALWKIRGFTDAFSLVSELRKILENGNSSQWAKEIADQQYSNAVYDIRRLVKSVKNIT